MDKRNGKKTGKLQTRLTRIIFMAVLATFFLMTVIVTYTSYQYYREREIGSQKNQMDKTASQISVFQNMLDNIAKQVICDDVLQKGLVTQPSSVGRYLYQKRNVQETLLTYSHIMDSIREIMIYTTDGRTFSSRTIKDPFQPEKNDWYENFWETGRTSGFTEVHKSEPNQDGYTVDVISYIMSYYSVENPGEELGKLVISVDFEEIEKMAYLESELLEGYCLYDGQGKALVTEGVLKQEYRGSVLREEGSSVFNEKGDIYISTGGMEDNWLLVSEISRSRLVHRSFQAYFYLTVLFVFIIGGLISTLNIVIRKFVKPIHKLSETAEAVGRGNFDVRVNIHTDDELEMLSEVFNKMIVDIQNLMNESVEHEKILRKMQIENLMLQINPHFIYNTMNSIVYMARMNGNTQIADFANAFISLLQNTLDVTDSVYQTLRQELLNVKNYLYLQSYRYADKFAYEIECSEELMECKILNVMIQPAVENAIFHGIAPKDGKCALKISAVRKNDTVEICVEDNGVGMSEEILREQMSATYKQKEGVRKIGVANVRNRIRNIFGEPYDLKIESKAGVGTKVIMTIPYMKENLKESGEKQ